MQIGQIANSKCSSRSKGRRVPASSTCIVQDGLADSELSKVSRVGSGRRLAENSCAPFQLDQLIVLLPGARNFRWHFSAIC